MRTVVLAGVGLASLLACGGSSPPEPLAGPPITPPPPSAPVTPVAAGVVLHGDPVVGQQLYVQQAQCVACHPVDGQAGRGPSLVGLASTTVSFSDGTTQMLNLDDIADYVVGSLLEPNARIVTGFPGMMPSYRGQLTDEQQAALGAYVTCLALPHCAAAPACAPLCAAP